MNAIDIIIKKRDGKSLSKEEIEFFIKNFYKREITDYQMSAWLMASFIRGLSKEETVNLISAILSTGKILDWEFPVIDKHSTGGVGDKLSLIVVPLLASLGYKVAKLSGRGLGHTGGTIDKLESIPNFRTSLTLDEFKSLVEKIGCSIISQTEELVPVEKEIYSLRDVTGTVESIPLITSSILSKKIAGGAKTIIFDVKVGSGAFMKDIKTAEELALWLKDIGETFGKSINVVISDMNQPLGNAVGNLLEVLEAIDTLKGNGPEDLTELAIETAGTIASKELLKNSLSNGMAFNKFLDMVRAQGGDISNLSPSAKRYDFIALDSGYIGRLDAYLIGEAVRTLGAGRYRKEDRIDPNVGIILKKKMGDYVEKGEVLLEIYYNSEEKLSSSLRLTERAISINKDAVERYPLVYSVYS
ncbi:MAG: thymidine phosphorylase [Dictyoglomi bacterium]|nr:thymidine phosphorylase [Dictyoglomota bacterium]